MEMAKESRGTRRVMDDDGRERSKDNKLLLVGGKEQEWIGIMGGWPGGKVDIMGGMAGKRKKGEVQVLPR